MSLYPDDTPYSVYRHLKPCGEVFYIGIASTNKRPYETKNRNKFWKNMVKKYPDYEVQILTTNLSKDEACELEILLIDWYGRRDKKEGVLVNLTDGGESTYGRIMEDWQKELLSKRCKEIYLGENNPNYGNRWSEEQRKNMSGLQKRRYASGEAVVNLEGVYKGIKNRNDNWAKNPKLKLEMAVKVSKSLSKYDYLKIDIITGEILEEFPAFMKLKEFYPDVGKTVVNSVCNGHKVSYLGFLWRYRCKETGEVIIPELKSNKGFNKYYQVGDKKYLKMTYISKEKGLSHSTISNRFKSDNFPEYKIKPIENPYL